MPSIRKQCYPNLAVLISVLFLGSCSTTQIDIDYKSSDLVSPKGEQAAMFRIGQFVDRRNQAPDWLGELRGKYYFPKESLYTNQPVSLIVRDLVRQGADDREMLVEANVSAPYELYGQVTRLDGKVTDSTEAHAHIVFRLFNHDSNDEVYTANQRIDLNDAKLYGSGTDLGNFVEEALNQAIAKALDDKAFRETLQNNGSIDQ